MKRQGFTLLELLIVISIIGVLVGIALPALVVAKKHSKEKACQATVVQVCEGIDAYETKYADYPPSGMFVKGANDTNWGSESLVWHLFTTKGGPYLDMTKWEEKLVNTDADKTSKAPDNSAYMKTDLMELGDEFHNPIIYIHNRDYAKPAKYAKYTLASGKDVDINPQKSAKTGNYHAPGKYMLWSIGGDDENQNGGDEDMASWSK